MCLTTGQGGVGLIILVKEGERMEKCCVVKIVVTFVLLLFMAFLNSSRNECMLSRVHF